ncbi:MAG: AmmeMemoRadiSam system protein B [Deltaproteobacteria bacterium]|nr:AmmeMemoRadiSam system protein B [Deltaproteobacteria bacterium]MBW2331929.1 AmmeMemoRadiSam system protein B [Deltaproteobacteria bacterium]OQY16253.1 MAG: AmmeMemoRadiSam system protein B [Desulfobacterium sp. 4572_20]RLB13516.1 MAG: AmmeMemoRadiSam system protein B [Deltaproteobacteria bacterium]
MANQNKRQNFLLLSARWWIALGVIIIIPCLPFTRLIAQERIRKPAVAGSFYPMDKKQLTKTVDDFISNVKHKQIAGKILGLMSPHAGYVFSGQVAAYSYSQIKDRQYDTVIILGPSHRVHLIGASVGNWDAYVTPLGKVKVNREMVNALLSIGKPFHFVEQAHIMEHSVETQIPFLQRVLKKFDIVPIVMGPLSLINCNKVSEALVKIAKKRNVLFVASSDMSHFPDYSNANNVDRKTLALIEKDNPDSVFTSEKETLKKGISNLSTTLCGLSSVVTVMMTVKRLGANAVDILHYANSGDVTIHGHRETRRVVGYGAVAFYKQ